MENEKVNVKEITETVAGSLQNAQENAINTESLVQQVQDMSCKDLHEKAVQAILDDDKLDMEQKMRLIHEENADYDTHEEKNTGRVIKMQDAQTQNVGKVIRWCCEHWYVIAIGMTFGVIVTPASRKAIATAVKQIAA